MSTFFSVVGILIFLFFACCFFAAMGNHGRYKKRHENDFGCAVILFVAILIYGAYKILTGS